MGVGITLGVEGGGVSVNAGVSSGRGNSDGRDSTWTQSTVTAGNVLALQSGGDTSLRGAVGQADQILASVGGNLLLESLQDTSTYQSKQSNSGFSGSVCVTCAVPGSIAGNVGRGKMNSDYASVTQQTGLKAGDGGFLIDVGGNTTLIGSVISSSQQAVADGLNHLSTGTLRVEDIRNHAEYSASQVSVGGGFSFGGGGGETAGQGGVGQDKHGNVAAGGNAKPASSVPSDKSGLSMGLPVALSASGSASSTTRSGISEGVIEIRDEAAQQALTGKSAAETIASLNRDTTDTLGALKPIFDKEKIEAGFEIGTAFAGEMGQFLTNRVREADDLKAAMDAETDLERYKELQGQYEKKRLWLPGGTYRQLSNALLAAAAGNVGGAASEFAQRAVVSYIQQEGASKIGDLVAKKIIKEGSAEHIAWQAIIGCAGATGSGDSCGAGALGAGASVIVNSLLDEVSGLSNEAKETRRNLVAGLIVGAAGVLDPAAAAALNNAAIAEMDNNLLNPHRDHDLVALLARQDELSPEQQSALFDQLKQAHAVGTQEALTQMESVMGPVALGETRQELAELLADGSACAMVASCRLQLERSVKEIDRLLEAYETQRVLTPKLEGALIIAELAGGVGGLALQARNAILLGAKRIAGESLDGLLVRQTIREANSSLPPLRQAYVDEVSELEGIGLSLRAAGGDLEQIARALHAERRAIGIKYKDLTSPEILDEIHKRNLSRYGDPLGPSIDWLRAQGKDWVDIIRTSATVGGKYLGF